MHDAKIPAQVGGKSPSFSLIQIERTGVLGQAEYGIV